MLLLVAIILVAVVVVWKGYAEVKRKVEDRAKLAYLHGILIAIDPRAKDIRIHSHSKESYTLNKTDVYICLRDSDGEFYSDDMLIDVAIHELSHVVMEEYAPTHPPEFYEIYDELRNRAIRIKALDPNFKSPKMYCTHPME